MNSALLTHVREALPAIVLSTVFVVLAMVSAPLPAQSCGGGTLSCVGTYVSYGGGYSVCYGYLESSQTSSAGCDDGNVGSGCGGGGGVGHLTCADFDGGLLGVFPDCYPPPTPPTCADSGLLGAYPNCYPEPPPNPLCSDTGQTGTYPNCVTPTCQELGNCPVPPETCADTGQVGTFPDCQPQPPICSPAQGQSCTSSANSCGEVNYGTVSCDGSCSASTPSDASCPADPGQTVSCTPSSGNTAGVTESVTWQADIAGFSGQPTFSWNNPFGSPTSVLGPQSSFNSTYASTGQYAPSVTVTNYSGSASASCSPVTLEESSCPSSAQLSLVASPTRVRSGQNSTISFSFNNVPASTTCSLKENGALIQSQTSSSCSVSSGSIARTITKQSTYVLECGGESKQVIVNVPPEFIEF